MEARVDSRFRGDCRCHWRCCCRCGIGTCEGANEWSARSCGRAARASQCGHASAGRSGAHESSRCSVCAEVGGATTAGRGCEAQSTAGRVHAQAERSQRHGSGARGSDGAASGRDAAAKCAVRGRALLGGELRALAEWRNRMCSAVQCGAVRARRCDQSRGRRGSERPSRVEWSSDDQSADARHTNRISNAAIATPQPTGPDCRPNRNQTSACDCGQPSHAHRRQTAQPHARSHHHARTPLQRSPSSTLHLHLHLPHRTECVGLACCSFFFSFSFCFFLSVLLVWSQSS